MTTEDLIKYCKYYKGEEESPFGDNNTNKSLFWFLEKQFVNNCSMHWSFFKGWEESAKDYIQEHPNEENVLTDTSVSIYTKAIILYCEAMLEKWMPYQVDIIFEY